MWKCNKLLLSTRLVGKFTVQRDKHLNLLCKSQGKPTFLALNGHIILKPLWLLMGSVHYNYIIITLLYDIALCCVVLLCIVFDCVKLYPNVYCVVLLCWILFTFLHRLALHLQLPLNETTSCQVAHKVTTLCHQQALSAAGCTPASPSSSFSVHLCSSPSCCPGSTLPLAPFWCPCHCCPTVVVISFLHNVSVAVNFWFQLIL